MWMYTKQGCILYTIDGLSGDIPYLMIDGLPWSKDGYILVYTITHPYLGRSSIIPC